jgi:hypothetical protein
MQKYWQHIGLVCLFVYYFLMKTKLLLSLVNYENIRCTVDLITTVSIDYLYIE